jgi:hypothetical protein
MVIFESEIAAVKSSPMLQAPRLHSQDLKILAGIRTQAHRTTHVRFSPFRRPLHCALRGKHCLLVDTTSRACKLVYMENLKQVSQRYRRRPIFFFASLSNQCHSVDMLGRLPVKNQWRLATFGSLCTSTVKSSGAKAHHDDAPRNSVALRCPVQSRLSQ